MELTVLQFPKQYEFKITKTKKNQFQIYDIVRKKNILLTPEEWVRQHFLHYLNEKKISPSQIIVEKQFDLHGTQKRTDILLMKKNIPFVLFELKSPELKLLPLHLEQVSRYNLKILAPFLILSNGLQHVGFKKNEQGEYTPLSHWEDLF